MPTTLTPEKRQRANEIIANINLHKETVEILTNPENYAIETVHGARLANQHNVMRICDLILPNRVVYGKVKRQLHNLIQDHAKTMINYWKAFDEALMSDEVTTMPVLPELTETREQMSAVLAGFHISEETFLKMYNLVGFTVVD